MLRLWRGRGRYTIVGLLIVMFKSEEWYGCTIFEKNFMNLTHCH